LAFFFFFFFFSFFSFLFLAFFGVHGLFLDRYDTATNQVCFDEQRFPKDTETNFKGQNGKHYKLEDVWFMLQHREKQWLQYMKECNTFKFQIVSFLDHKELLNYLTGKIDKSAKITEPVELVSAPAVATSTSAAVASLPMMTGQTPMTTATTGGAEQDPALVEDLQDEAVYEEEEAAPVVERPLTEAELKVKRRKEATIQRDLEEMMKIGSEREMKLKEILADAEVVEQIQSHERPTMTKDMMLQSNTRNFKHILNLMYLRQTDGKHRMRGTTAVQTGAALSQKRGRNSSKKDGGAEGDKRTRPDVNIVPIIIVPAAMTSNITIANAKDFLENGQWISSQKKKEELRGSSAKPLSAGKVGFFHATHHEDGSESKARFEVVDNVRGFTSKDWNRVIAVFTNGKEWEFKGFKSSAPAKLFNEISGFYLAFKGDATPPSISNWKINILKLEKNARHNDITANRDFWEILKKETGKKPQFNGLFG
jgi:parafibromin